MKAKNFRYGIIGAGFAGLSTAYWLIRKGVRDICLVEKERSAALAASGRNASMICQIVRDEILCHLMLESVERIKKQWLPEFPDIRFQERGSLHVGRPEDLDALGNATRLAARFGVLTERLSRAATVTRYPYLQETAFEEALFCPSDGVIDVEAMSRSLFAFCKTEGVTFQFSHTAKPVMNPDGLFEWQDSFGERVTAEILINAAGAWAGEIARSAGAQDLPVLPYRRHLFLTGRYPFGADSVSSWPIVWDVANGVYFRPESETLLLSPCDEEPYVPGPALVDSKAKEWLRAKLEAFLPAAEGLSYTQIWAGLRTFSADRRFVIGWDGKQKNFFWVACLGGYGMTASAGVGECAASWILNEETKPEWKEAFSPERFLAVKPF